MNKHQLLDLLALIEQRNITRAASRRHVSQSAYSRRLQAIEASRGLQLVDRSRRPAGPTPALEATRDEIESALMAIDRVQRNLMLGAEISGEVTIAASHALASGILPSALGTIKPLLRNQRIQLHSADQDACFQMLMTGEVALMLSYETAQHALPPSAQLVTKLVVGRDQLVAVCEPDMAETLRTTKPGTKRVPLIAFPRDVFLGRVFADEINRVTDHDFTEIMVTGFTSAVLASAEAGIGMAWLPLSLVSDAIREKRLALLDDALFPRADMLISMLQLKTRNTPSFQVIWTALAECICAEDAVG